MVKQEQYTDNHRAHVKTKNKKFNNNCNSKRSHTLKFSNPTCVLKTDKSMANYQGNNTTDQCWGSNDAEYPVHAPSHT